MLTVYEWLLKEKLMHVFIVFWLTELALQVTHRLVGVDGVPIKVEGIVSAPITIGKVTLQHDFKMAEQITAEAILRLDFLEANKCILDLAGGKIQITDKTVPLIPQPLNKGSAMYKSYSNREPDYSTKG